MPCASYQCNSARRIVPSDRLTLATPFRFLQRPLPNRACKVGSSRIRLPTAIVSMPVIEPITLKSSVIPEDITNNEHRVQGRRPTLAFSGAATGIQKTLRSLRRGLRCNGLLCAIPARNLALVFLTNSEVIHNVFFIGAIYQYQRSVLCPETYPSA